MEAISSCSAHSSSVDIDFKSLWFTTVPNHDFVSAGVLVGRKHEQNKADLSLFVRTEEFQAVVLLRLQNANRLTSSDEATQPDFTVQATQVFFHNL